MSLHPAFARPRNLDQAAQVMGGLSSGAMIIAGGQEMMPSVNYGALMPEVYIDIGHIKDLQGITEADGQIHIGALTVHRDVQQSDVTQSKVPLLAYAAAQVGGGWQVHNRGTIGGNVVSMHPLYDILPSLMALSAEVDVLKDGTEQRTALADLLKDSSHGLGSESLLVRVVLKPMSAGAGWAYEKLKITAGGYGSANAAAIVTLDGEKITSLRVVVGAVSELPVDVSDVLGGCRGQAWSEHLADEVEAKVATEVKNPLSDHQGDGDWRKAMAGVMARRAIEAAIKKAQ
ncbi:MAG: FAD binding domain-containing protein [Rhodospirillaceae bacterium]